MSPFHAFKWLCEFFVIAGICVSVYWYIFNQINHTVISIYLSVEHFWRCSHYMRSRDYETVQHPSVALSICLSVPSFNRSCGMRRVFAAERHASTWNRSTAAAARRPAANASCFTLTADVYRMLNRPYTDLFLRVILEKVSTWRVRQMSST